VTKKNDRAQAVAFDFKRMSLPSPIFWTRRQNESGGEDDAFFANIYRASEQSVGCAETKSLENMSPRTARPLLFSGAPAFLPLSDPRREAADRGLRGMA